MKKHPNERAAQRGGALVMAVFLIAIMIALSTAIFTTAHRENKLAHASVARTTVLYIAEAGLHAAAADIYAGGSGVKGSLGSRVSFGGGQYFVTAVDNGDDTYTLTCNAVYDNEVQAIEATLSVSYVSLFSKGLFGDIDLGATGNVFTDSYDSTLGTYASQAVNFDATSGRSYALANGDLGSNGDITLRGGVVVLGDATPGPGHAVTTIGAGVHVSGSTTPASAPSPLPALPYSPPVVSLGPLTSSIALPTGTFRFDRVTLNSWDTLTINGDVSLYVDGDWDQTGNASVVISPGATLKVYHGGSTFKLTGGGLVNVDQKASQFQLYSQATTVDLGGTSDFYGAVYAPAATVTPTGTGVLYGSFVGREVYISGTADFHYDEDLANLSTSSTPSAVHIVSWHFVKPTL